MLAVKGMVHVAGTTYRVSKLYAGMYEVVRILDDRRVGAFESEPKLTVMAECIEPDLLREIAIQALKQGKVTWSARGRAR